MNIQHNNGQFFINGEPVKTGQVYRLIVKLIEENAEQYKTIQKLLRDSEEGEEL